MSPSVVNTQTQQEPITTSEKDTLSSPPLTSSPEIPRGKMDPDFNVTHQTENYLNNSPTSSVMDNPNADQNYVDHDSRHQEFDNSDLATPSTDHNHIDHDNIQHYSDFTTPNPYACLAEQEQPDVDSISLETIEKAPPTPTLQITPPGAPKKRKNFAWTNKEWLNPPQLVKAHILVVSVRHALKNIIQIQIQIVTVYCRVDIQICVSIVMNVLVRLNSDNLWFCDHCSGYRLFRFGVKLMHIAHQPDIIVTP